MSSWNPAWTSCKSDWNELISQSFIVAQVKGVNWSPFSLVGQVSPIIKTPTMLTLITPPHTRFLTVIALRSPHLFLTVTAERSRTEWNQKGAGFSTLMTLNLSPRWRHNPLTNIMYGKELWPLHKLYFYGNNRICMYTNVQTTPHCEVLHQSM